MEDINRIVELYSPKAFAIAFRLTGNRAEAWDLVQNAMLRVMRSYSTYDPSYSVDQWLNRIVRNLYIDQLRASSRRKEDSLDEAPSEDSRTLSETIADEEPGPERMLEKAATRDIVQSALESLPVELRMAVILVDMEGYAYDEAAAVLEIPASTLGVHVFRGRKLLRAALGGQFQEGR
ncbi:MAG: RNA polymerase sigma factor [Elusimicrobia bacterium]|nr:RNA polymerase sigma factor [Elusimicrobiota bacterium]